jgi:hypothetical protein
VSGLLVRVVVDVVLRVEYLVDVLQSCVAVPTAEATCSRCRLAQARIVRFCP